MNYYRVCKFLWGDMLFVSEHIWRQISLMFCIFIAQNRRWKKMLNFFGKFWRNWESECVIILWRPFLNVITGIVGHMETLNNIACFSYCRGAIDECSIDSNNSVLNFWNTCDWWHISCFWDKPKFSTELLRPSDQFSVNQQKVTLPKFAPKIQPACGHLLTSWFTISLWVKLIVRYYFLLLSTNIYKPQTITDTVIGWLSI